MRKMSDAEIEKHLKETRKKAKAEYERMLRGELERANRSRREDGKKELTMQELKERKRKYEKNLFPMSPFNK